MAWSRRRCITAGWSVMPMLTQSMLEDNNDWGEALWKLPGRDVKVPSAIMMESRGTEYLSCASASAS